jgi:hypothetical protein
LYAEVLPETYLIWFNGFFSSALSGETGRAFLARRRLSEGSQNVPGAEVAASTGADWRPDAGEHLAPVSKRQPGHLVLQFNPEALRIGTGRPLHLPHQEGGAVVPV